MAPRRAPAGEAWRTRTLTIYLTRIVPPCERIPRQTVAWRGNRPAPAPDPGPAPAGAGYAPDSVYATVKEAAKQCYLRALKVLPPDLKEALARATLEDPLRPNAVHPVTRKNTMTNTGRHLPAMHYEFVGGRDDFPADALRLHCLPKGSGSENMSFLKMFIPADGVKAVKRFVLECIVDAGPKPCPPTIVGVGLGGTADLCAALAKKAVLRPLGTHNDDPVIAAIEDELFAAANELGIGPMGLGGRNTVLGVHIEHAHTHITQNPVAVNLQCWAARRASALITPDGEVTYGF